MSDVEITRKEPLTRQEAAERLSALAAALAEGGHVEIELGASTVKMHVPDHVRCEIEVEIDGTEIELEVELTWSTEAARPARRRTAKTAAAH
ncbi:amphi-Trp domain-containing protein [Pseudonocardia pini]|uniref:amphi-Trp domain-containing protein n=1 Tax=Pseudonocardia pini TaxID=2758030 RepID=UPI0015F0FC78|nr:amphi-Trp domain-containing protein [Pseudonocardia pini]